MNPGRVACRRCRAFAVLSLRNKSEYSIGAAYRSYINACKNSPFISPFGILLPSLAINEVTKTTFTDQIFSEFKIARCSKPSAANIEDLPIIKEHIVCGVAHNKRQAKKIDGYFDKKGNLVAIYTDIPIEPGEYEWELESGSDKSYIYKNHYELGRLIKINNNSWLLLPGTAVIEAVSDESQLDSASQYMFHQEKRAALYLK